MRIPNVEHFHNNAEIQHKIYIAPILAQRTTIISSDKQRDKCIKRIEKKCRNSMEYKDLIKYLKSEMDMDSCEFFPNIRTGKGNSMTEIHHEPYDLYTICGIILKKHEMENDGVINEMMVAKEVMRCHYAGLIGLVPLVGVAHDLVHDGKLFVPLSCVCGRFAKFTELYYDAILEYDDTILDKLEKQVELTKEGNFDMSILNISYVYAKMQGVDDELPEYIPETEPENDSNALVA